MNFLTFALTVGGITTISQFSEVESKKYTPDWPSLDSRPIPSWYDQGKFGLSIYWGVYSVPSFIKHQQEEWFWHAWITEKVPEVVKYMKDNYPPDFTYADFAAEWKGEFFDPNEWADILQASGATYIAFTAKHHEGFAMWPSKYYFNWNAVDVGLKKDVMDLLASAIRNRTNLHFGIYYSLFEFYDPLYLEDKAKSYATDIFVKEKTMPALQELVERYKPDFIWSDGDWEASYEYWDSREFLAWLFNDSPVKDTVVVNDRWGFGAWCKHGGFWTCKDSFWPGHIMQHKWEHCMPIQIGSYGLNRDAPLSDYYTAKQILERMIQVFSWNGNVLLNVGPSADGRILPIFEERLRQLGSWLKVNGEGVYGTTAWRYCNDTTPGVWYTAKEKQNEVYAFLFKWPIDNKIVLHRIQPTSKTQVTLLGYKGAEEFKWSKHPAGGVTISFPIIPFYEMPCDWVWALKITNIL